MSIKERILLTIAVAFSSSNDNKFLTGLNKSIRHRDILLWMPSGYSRKNFYAMIGNLRRSGLLRRVKVNENTAVQLTPKGLSELVNRYGHTGLAGEKWDGHWRLILGRLGGKRQGSGLGYLLRGVYISPFEFSDALIRKLGEGKESSKTRFFYDASEKFPDPRGLAVAAWGLNELNNRYASLNRRFQMALGQQIMEKKLTALRSVRADFVNIARDDPWLPSELLPAGWAFFEVRNELNKYLSII
jgi:DNA-binding transcriptional regulator PaaX